MKIAVKKVHCPKCEKLVHVREQVNDGLTQLLCVRCGQIIWVWDTIKWHQVRE